MVDLGSHSASTARRGMPGYIVCGFVGSGMAVA